MENVRAVYVYVNSVFVFRVNIAAYVTAFIYNKAFFACLFCFVSEHAAEKACAYNKIIIFFHLYFLRNATYMRLKIIITPNYCKVKALFPKKVFLFGKCAAIVCFFSPESMRQILKKDVKGL